MSTLFVPLITTWSLNLFSSRNFFLLSCNDLKLIFLIYVLYHLNHQIAKYIKFVEIKKHLEILLLPPPQKKFASSKIFIQIYLTKKLITGYPNLKETSVWIITINRIQANKPLID